MFVMVHSMPIQIRFRIEIVLAKAKYNLSLDLKMKKIDFITIKGRQLTTDVTKS